LRLSFWCLTEVERVVFNVHKIANALRYILQKFHISLIFLTDIFMNLTGAIYLSLKAAFPSYLLGDVTISCLHIGFGLFGSVKAV